MGPPIISLHFLHHFLHLGGGKLGHTTGRLAVIYAKPGGGGQMGGGGDLGPVEVDLTTIRVMAFSRAGSRVSHMGK